MLRQSGKQAQSAVHPSKNTSGLRDKTARALTPHPGRDLVYSVTGGGIHPVAKRIAEITGGRPFDGFKSKAAFEEIAVAVIDCGGTARVGVYPMKGILTVDVHATTPAGPLAKFINEQNFVSGVRVENVIPLD